jgi:hypothetical protein
MKMLIGILAAVILMPVGWWAFNKAVAGQDFYNWIWVPAFFLSVFGIMLVLARISHWMHN